MIVSYGLRIGYNKGQPHKLKRFKMINVRHLMSPQNQTIPKHQSRNLIKFINVVRLQTFMGFVCPVV